MLLQDMKKNQEISNNFYLVTIPVNLAECHFWFYIHPSHIEF